MRDDDPPIVFLISPADVSGKRAKMMESPRATFDAARKLQSDDGVPIGEAFAFMSALYFRGKLAYANHFQRPSGNLPGTLVITAGRGLVTPDFPVRIADLRRMRRTRIHDKPGKYRNAVRRDALDLEAEASDATLFVLLGSLATGKYLDVLVPILGERLVYPKALIGMGDMKRGATLLNAVRDNRELDYVSPLEEGETG